MMQRSGNPLLRRAVANAAVDTDAAGNREVTKAQPRPGGSAGRGDRDGRAGGAGAAGAPLAGTLIFA